MDPRHSFNKSSEAYNSSEKSMMLQPVAPPPVYQDNPPSFQSQPVGQGPYPGESVVAVQSAVFVPNTPLVNPAPEYTAYSIFTMLCCCFQLGTAALVYSLSTRNANYSGQRELAERNSKTARTLNHASVAFGIICTVLFLVLIFVLKNNIQA